MEEPSPAQYLEDGEGIGVLLGARFVEGEKWGCLPTGRPLAHRTSDRKWQDFQQRV